MFIIQSKWSKYKYGGTLLSNGQVLKDGTSFKNEHLFLFHLFETKKQKSMLRNPSKNQKLFETLRTLYSHSPDPREYNWICFEWGDNPRYPETLTTHSIHLILYMLKQYVHEHGDFDTEIEEETTKDEIKKDKKESFPWSDAWPSEPNAEYDDLYHTCMQLINYINNGRAV